MLRTQPDLVTRLWPSDRSRILSIFFHLNSVFFQGWPWPEVLHPVLEKHDAENSQFIMFPDRVTFRTGHLRSGQACLSEVTRFQLCSMDLDIRIQIHCQPCLERRKKITSFIKSFYTPTSFLFLVGILRIFRCLLSALQWILITEERERERENNVCFPPRDCLDIGICFPNVLVRKRDDGISMRMLTTGYFSVAGSPFSYLGQYLF